MAQMNRSAGDILSSRLLINLCIGVIVWGCSSNLLAQALLFEPQLVDFGQAADPAAKLTQFVDLRNSGTTDIEVSKVSAGCGCIVPTIVGNRRIKAGEACRIQLCLHRDVAMLGEHTYKVIAIGAGDAGVVASAFAKYGFMPEIECFPKEATILASADNPSSALGVGSVAVHLVDHGTTAAKILGVDLSSQFLESSILEMRYTNTKGEVTHAFDVNVIFPAGWPVGPVNEFVTIRTDNLKFQKITIPVHGEVTGSIKVSPSVLFLGSIQPGGRFKRTITLTADHEIILDRIRPASSTMTVGSNASDDGKKVIITISDIAAERGADTLVYETGIYIPIISPRSYTQKVMIYGYLAGRAPTTVHAQGAQPSSQP